MLTFSVKVQFKDSVETLETSASSSMQAIMEIMGKYWDLKPISIMAIPK
jgi:hypothetical protein